MPESEPAAGRADTAVPPVAVPEPLAAAHTDWLRNTLLIAGRRAEVARWREAAAGAGVVPWRLNLEQMEEDWFLSLAAPTDGARAISLTGARILARRLRDAVAANQERALARVGTDRRCPVDLHRLLPVPPAILGLGPEDGQSRAWLMSHWGTTRALRGVRALPAKADGRRRGADQVLVEFWSADWSPWQAVVRLRRAWPELGFVLTPDYAAGRDGDDGRDG